MEPAVSFQAINYSSSAAYTSGELAYNFCNRVLVRDTKLLVNKDLYIEEFYLYVCPPVIFVCFFSIIFNATLMSISRQSKLINKSPIMLLSLNLAFTDLIASTLNGLNIFYGSYLRVVFKFPVNNCAMLTLELFRFTAVLASSLHLLALAFVHYRGTVNPLHYRSSIFYSRHLSRTINIISLCCWLVPLTLMIVWFNSTPCQGFQTAECDYFFFLGYNFRRMILTAFAVPLLFMSVIYVRIFLIISRHQKGLRLPPPIQQQQQFSGTVASGRPLEEIESKQRAPIDGGGDLSDGVGKGDQQRKRRRRRQRLEAKNCPVCSQRNQFQDAATNQRNETTTTVETAKTDVESVSILSVEVEATEEEEEEEENTWTGSGECGPTGGQCETAALMSRAQAVRLIQKNDDDSYTIRNKSQLETTMASGQRTGTGPTGNDYNGTKLICNGKATAAAGEKDALAAAAGAFQSLRPEPVTGSEIDNDPKEQKLTPLLVDLGHATKAEGAACSGLGDDQGDDDDDHDAAAWMTPTKLNCERQPPSVVALGRTGPAGASEQVAAPSRPLADHASATSRDCVSQSSTLQPETTTTTHSPRPKSEGPGQLANHGDGGGARVRGNCKVSADATAQQLHSQWAATTAQQPRRGASSSARPELVSAGDSLCGPKLELLTDTDNEATAVALAGQRSSASNQTDLVTSLGGGGIPTGETTGQVQQRKGPFGKVAAGTSNSSSTSTASEKLREQRNRTIATSSYTKLQERRPLKTDPVDGGDGARVGLTLWCTCDNKLNQSTIKSLRRSNTVASPANAAAATHRRATTKTTKLGLAPSPPAPSISSGFVANSSLRFQLTERPRNGSGGASSEANSGSRSGSGGSVSGSSGGSSSGSSSSSSSSGDKATTAPAPRARPAHKSSSLHVSAPAFDATSMTVTTLTSGRPAHNFDSTSSISNRNHRHRHHHHHRHHRHQEPQRVNVKKVADSPTNTKALVTTLLILGTYFVSYLPVLVFQMLTCIDGCEIPLYKLKPKMRLFFGTMTTLLLIAKSIVDPLIYSYRTNEVQQAISRYMSKRRSKSSSRATSLYTSQRLNHGGGGGSQATQGTNLNTSSFKLLNSTNSSLRGPSSRAASIRVNQHHFDRPGQTLATAETLVEEEGNEPPVTKLTSNAQVVPMVSIRDSADQSRNCEEGEAELARQSDLIVNKSKQQLAGDKGGRNDATRRSLSSNCLQESHLNSTTTTKEDDAKTTANVTKERTANSSGDSNRATEQAASDKPESDIPNASMIQGAADRSASSRGRPLDKTTTSLTTNTTKTTSDIVC